MIRFFPCRRNHLILLCALFILMVAGLAANVRVYFEGDFEGVYLLKGRAGYCLEFRDDLLLGDQERLIGKMEFKWLHDRIFHDAQTPPPGNLVYRWNKSRGRGYIHSTDPDGNELIISLSRFRDDQGGVPRGLFLGGDLPTFLYAEEKMNLNQTGMAYKASGGHWRHIWCNANEGIAGAKSMKSVLFPSSWEFLGSRVLFSTWRELALESSHRMVVDGVPLHMDRFLFYKVETHYVILAIRIRNIGSDPVRYFYGYGDEPWLGDYGVSIGNVGWAEGKLYYYAGMVDPRVHDTAGMIDIGNPMAFDDRYRHASGLANFISWIGGVPPEKVYFSNRDGDVIPESRKVLLDSPLSRMIECQWGPRHLAPGQSETILLAIGMADWNKETGLPVRPDLQHDLARVQQVISDN